MLMQSLTYSVTKPLLTLIIGGAILWQAAEHSGSTHARAIVHVSMTNVEITVDNDRFWVESLEETPIVRELCPGRHLVRMRRGGHILYEEEFTAELDGDIILSAWDGYTDGRSPERDH